MEPTAPAEGGVAKRPRACIPCHALKVRCNASRVGMPCTRCVRTHREARCELTPLPDRSAARLSKRRKLTEDHAPARATPPADVNEDALNGVSSSAVEDATVIGAGDLPAPAPAEHVLDWTSTNASSLLRDDSSVHAVPQEDSQLEICREMSQWGSDFTVRTNVGQADQGQEILEYHDGVNSVTILGDVFGRKAPRKFVRIVLRDKDAQEQQGVPNPDADSREWLRKRGAFTLPSNEACESILRLYFEHVYHYSPILDRQQFMSEFHKGKAPIFLMQCILALMVPYLSMELLAKAGYSDRFKAQKEWYSKAELLYALRAEKSQLRLLQGSLILGCLHFSFGTDKDYRYWLTNSVRLASQMGLHRKQLARHVDPRTKKLFRRLWWVVYNRDILFSISGLHNLRQLNDRNCDVPLLSQDDFEADDVYDELLQPLPQPTSLHKDYLIENCKLAQICARFVDRFGALGITPSQLDCNELEKAMSEWKLDLPPNLNVSLVSNWTFDNVWILVLRAMSTRFECVFFRSAREVFRTSGQHSLAQQFLQKQQDAMLELDTILTRIMLHDLVRYCPLSVMTTAGTVLAMHIENALSSNTPELQHIVARMHIQNGLTYLHRTSEYWESSQWTLRMFEVIVSRTSLSSLQLSDRPNFDVASMNPFVRSDTELDTSDRNYHTVANGYSYHNNDGNYHSDAIVSGPPLPEYFNDVNGDVPFDDVLGRNPAEWLNELLGSQFSEMESCLW